MSQAITVLHQRSEPGTYEVKTLSGSLYEIVINDDGSSTSRRIPSGEDRTLRGDGELWKLKDGMLVGIGYPAIFSLEDIDDEGETAIRRTSSVTEISRVS